MYLEENERKIEEENANYEFDYNYTFSESDKVVLILDKNTKKYMEWISLFLRVIGILTIIFGIIYSLFIIGIPIIFLGLKQFQAGKYLNQTLISKNEEDFKKFFEESGKYVIYYVMCIIIGIAFSILAIFTMIIIGFLISNS